MNKIFINTVLSILSDTVVLVSDVTSHHIRAVLEDTAHSNKITVDFERKYKSDNLQDEIITYIKYNSRRVAASMELPIRGHIILKKIEVLLLTDYVALRFALTDSLSNYEIAKIAVDKITIHSRDNAIYVSDFTGSACLFVKHKYIGKESYSVSMNALDLIGMYNCKSDIIEFFL